MTDLHAIEQLVAQTELLAAIKELRSLTGWGLQESKDAIDEYRTRGAWPPSLFAALAHQPPVQPSTADIRQAQLAAALEAVAEQLGHAPHVHLAARALRVKYGGHLVMLRDRSFFVRNHGGQPIVELVISHDDVDDVAIDPSTPTFLRVVVGGSTERFVLHAPDAEAALALFRGSGR